MGRGTRARMIAGLATAAAALTLATPPALAGGEKVLVDETLPGPLGGAQLCLLGRCLPEIKGIDNVRVVISRDGPDLEGPGLVNASQPDCTADINVGYTATTPGGQGALYVDVTYDVVDKNGNVVRSESHSAQLAGAVATMEQELFTLCASAL